MPGKYQVFIEQQIIDYLQSLDDSTRKEIMSFIRLLSDSPSQGGDFPESDETGRDTYCKIISDHALSYYPDHAASEIKVFELIKADK